MCCQKGCTSCSSTNPSVCYSCSAIRQYEEGTYRCLCPEGYGEFEPLQRECRITIAHTCAACRIGYYLDLLSGTCKACSGCAQCEVPVQSGRLHAFCDYLTYMRAQDVIFSVSHSALLTSDLGVSPTFQPVCTSPCIDDSYEYIANTG